MTNFQTRLLLALSTGILLCGAHGLWAPLAWIAPVPLLVGLANASWRESLWMGLLCGGCEAMILFGVTHAGWAVFATLVCAYALGRALFTLGVRCFGGHDRWCLGAASLWVLLEMGHAALPMSLPNLLGDTQHTGLALPLASLGGTWLIGFVLVWIAGLLSRVWLAKEQSQKALLGAVAICSVLLVIANAQTPTPGGSLRVGLVQGGIPTWLYLRSHDDKAWWDVPGEVYERLTRALPDTDLVVWPEAPLPYRWGPGGGGEFESLLDRLKEIHSPILTGVFRADTQSLVYNAALLFNEQGEQWVDKRRLVLEAELWLTPGEVIDSLEMEDGTRLGPIFCLESVLPEYARRVVVDAGADILVVLADGSRFGRTPVGRMHAQRSAIRSVEVGRALIHAGQQGYSTLYRPDGIEQEGWPLYTAQAGVIEVPKFTGLTLFSKFPHLMGQIAGLLVLLVGLWSIWARQNKPT